MSTQPPQPLQLSRLIPKYLIKLTAEPFAFPGLLGFSPKASDHSKGGQITCEMPEEVVTDQEAVEIGKHLQILLRGEWARGGRKGEVPEVEVVRVLWRGEGRSEGRERQERVKVMTKGQG